MMNEWTWVRDEIKMGIQKIYFLAWQLHTRTQTIEPLCVILKRNFLFWMNLVKGRTNLSNLYGQKWAEQWQQISKKAHLIHTILQVAAELGISPSIKSVSTLKHHGIYGENTFIYTGLILVRGWSTVKHVYPCTIQYIFCSTHRALCILLGACVRPIHEWN